MNLDYIKYLKPCGTCYKCGLPCEGLFCNDKQKEQYIRNLERQIKVGKKAGYGLAGSTH